MIGTAMSEEYKVELCTDDSLINISPKSFNTPPEILARIRKVLKRSKSIQTILYADECSAALYITKESYELNGSLEQASATFPDLDPVRAYHAFVKQNRKSGVIELHRNARSLFHLQPEAPSPRVTFFSPFGAWQLNTQLDSIVGNALQIRGADCRVITCDGMFYEDCYLLRHSEDPKSTCSRCTHCARQMFNEERPLENTPLSNYVREEDWQAAHSWVEAIATEDLKRATFENMPMGEWMIPTICSYFRYSEEHLSPPLLTDEVAKVFRKYLTYAYVTYRGMRRAFEEQSTTHLIIFNGNGFSQRPALELAKSLGIKVLSYHPGLIDRSYMFVEDDVSCALLPQIQFVEKWMEIPLQKNELEKVKNYIFAREYGVGYNRSSFYETTNSSVDVRKALHIPADKKIISVMTSSKYELSYNPEFRALPDQLTCLTHLIEMFREREDYLVIRHHPQISSSQIGSPDGHFILEILKQKKNLPENVRIIMPDEAITSYELLRESDACMTFYSSIGVEALFRGVPTAIFEGTINAFAATEFISSSEAPHLASVLDRLLSRNGMLSEAELQKAYRFVHAFYFLYSDIFRSFSTTPEGRADIHIKDLNELQPGTDRTLDKVCDFILEGKDFHNLPGRNEKSRSTEDEVHFLQAERSALVDVASSKTYGDSLHKLMHSDFTICSDDPDMSSNIGPVEKIHWEQSLPSLLAQLDSLLCKVETSYVVFHAKGVEWDGTFLSTSLQMLQEQSLHGIVWDSWLLGQGLEAIRISLRPFGPKIFSPADYDEFKSNPVLLFCTGVFRVSSLKQVIESLLGEKHLIHCGTIVEILAHFIQQKKALMSINSQHALADTRAIDLPAHLIPKESTLREQFHSQADNKKEGIMTFENIVSLYNSGAYDELQKVLPELCLHDPLYYYPSALVEMKVGSTDRAIKMLKDLLTHVPDHLHAQALKKEIEQMQPTSQPITRQIELECSLDDALYCLKNDDLEKASTILDSIEGSGKIERDYFYVKALFYYSQSKYTDCLQALKRELATYPENHQAQSFKQAIEQVL